MRFGRGEEQEARKYTVGSHSNAVNDVVLKKYIAEGRAERRESKAANCGNTMKKVLH